MKKLFKRELKKGFTLIEVLITITIVGIISSVALVSYKNYVTTSNEVATKQEMTQLAQVYQMGMATGEIDLSGSVTFDLLSAYYRTVTGTDMPYTNQELSYVDNNKLQLERRGIIVQYDLTTNKMEVNE